MTDPSGSVIDMQSRAAAPALALYVTFPEAGPAAPALLTQLARTLVGVVGQQAPGAKTRSTLVGAAARRRGTLADVGWPVTQRGVGRLVVDSDAREVVLNGHVVAMTFKEFGLLEYLLRSPHRAVTREELLAKVWRRRAWGDGMRTVDVHVRRLREKLGGCLQIVTVRGVGYRCDPTPEVVLVGSGDAD